MKALVLSSGGIDSTACIAVAADKFEKENVIALSVTYGQKHSKEIVSAKAVADFYGIEHILLDLSEMFKFSDCSLLSHSDKEIPHEAYDSQITKTNGSPVSTYVPFRNGLFLSSAAAIAISKGCGVIYYGAHGDDSAGNAYPDCSPEFNKAMGDAIFLGSGGQLTVEAPFVSMPKREVVKIGTQLGAPFHLTWSCYEGGEKQCGKCGTCIDRRKAFEANGLCDPVGYVE
ncbi:MAG: 7-cyano-7-deazaguanine synthase QueC [Oscillospiraceae bacterium]